jgi:hypothetical protein
VPATIVEGSWSLYLSLPDTFASLYEKSRYSIRLANTDVAFSSTNGWNLICSGLSITKNAPGETTTDTVFAMIPSPASVTRQTGTTGKRGGQTGITVERRHMPGMVSITAENPSAANPVIQLVSHDGSVVHIRFASERSGNIWRVMIDTRVLSAGTYLCLIRIGDRVLHERMIIGSP